MKLENTNEENKESKLYFEGKTHSPERVKQNVRDTSIEGERIHTNNGSLSTGKHNVHKYLLEVGEAQSRTMISNSTGYPINYITRYVHQLIKEGKLLESSEKMPCKATGMRVYYVIANVVENAGERN